ncbi:MAG: DUF3422 domain-containing protein [Burkholderiales bacterium]|nr:DUF3422 domain-containing protein [Burkholderiales bacterium]
MPAEDALRRELHDEVHARPAARIRLPARVLHVAVLNEGVSPEDEARHIAALPHAPAVDAAAQHGAYLQLRLHGALLRRERHSEFTRYTLIAAPPGAGPGTDAVDVPPAWWRAIPGRLVAAIELDLAQGELADAQAALAELRRGFGAEEVVASLLGDGYALAVTDFRVQADGFERIAVRCAGGTTATRAGRIVQRLLELESYRLMALRGLPAAKALAGTLREAEAELVDITARTVDRDSADADLLRRLTALAARIEQATAANGYRFSATAAYHAIVQQRSAELRERAVPGTQALGVFMQRRLTPAMATVASTAERLAALSLRIERAGALLRTRVDIATEVQNQQLLARLTRGQELQLRLQSTVEGLSIAAISYYVVSLVLYGAKAAKAAGLPLEPELVAGAAIPLVLWGVWRLVRRIHERLHAPV